MIVITGAAGFIGSYLTGYLNKSGYEDLILVDDFSFPEKNRNLEGKIFDRKIDRTEFPEWLEEHPGKIDMVFHIGARTDTTEPDKAIFDKWNVNYSRALWRICAGHRIPLIYASSAATYGMGEFGYRDDHEIVTKLQPLNPYGVSKNEFDIWALRQPEQPPFWAGLKFFNVYGPNEYHKGRMASVIFHAFHQISATGKMKLFQSHRPDFKDGEQRRDFIYVKDIARVCLWLMNHPPENGLYNLGTGTARTFLDLTRNTFHAMGKKVSVEFIPTPEDIRDQYQHFTEADMSKLRSAGYRTPFYSLEEGIEEYVKSFLLPDKYF